MFFTLHLALSQGCSSICYYSAHSLACLWLASSGYYKLSNQTMALLDHGIHTVLYGSKCDRAYSNTWPDVYVHVYIW